MLVSVYVENIALIKKLNIDFSDGFTVITGETGGGKSIIIDSLSLLCGARGDKSLIRTGESQAIVEGVFSFDNKCFRNDSDFEEFTEEDNDCVTVYRRITSDGKNVCKINGRTVQLAKLKAFVSKLMNIHGQQDTQLLSDPASHLMLLDTYAGTEDEIKNYSLKYSEYTDLKTEYERLKKLGDEKLERLDVIDFQLNELENAKIRIGEEEELESEKNVLSNYEKIYSGVKTALDILDGRDSVLNKIYKSNDSVKRISSMLPKLEEVSSRLESCSYELDDIINCLKESINVSSESPEKRIDEIEDRLSVISRLKRKYRTDEKGLKEKYENLSIEKSEIDNNDEKITDCEVSLKNCEKELCELSEKLSSKRKNAAKKLEKEIEHHLASLDMPFVTFITEFSAVPFNETGSDSAEFLISANKGEEPKPIARIASGGELSRIMLSVKSAFSAIDGVNTVIFDEIDTGISGKTSERLGLKLKELSSNGVQILCVTHSAQIACLADSHFKVSKSALNDNRTYTSVNKLDFEGRVNEIARIMGGITVTDSVMSASRELLLKNSKEHI